MLEDILEDVNYEYNSSRSSLIKLEYIQRKRMALEDKIYTLRESLAEQEINVPEQASYNAIFNIETEGKAKDILTMKAMNACIESPEFDDSFFIDRLFRGITSETIRLQLIEGQLLVTINLDETAGSLSSYAQAIRIVREQLRANIKTPPPSRELASHFWKEKIYGPAREGKTVTRRVYDRKTKAYQTKDITAEQTQKYWDTMQARMAQAGGIAPFWEILDKGSQFFSSYEDSGGEGYPITEPTNFVDRSITEIQELFRTDRREYEDSMYRECDRFREQIEEGRRILEEIDRMIEELESLDEAALLMEKIGERIEYADREKIEALLSEIGSGRIENFHLVGGSRVELTGPAGRAAGIRVRPYISDIMRAMGTEY
jgi:hypothetical protein